MHLETESWSGVKCNLKGRRWPAVLLISLLLSGLAGCAEQPELASPYGFPESGLLSLVTDDESLRPDGYAAHLCVPAADADLDTDGVNAKAFGLFDLSGAEVLSQHNIYDKVYPASTTKILTCLIALERGDMNETVTVPEEAKITVSGSSMADLQPGDALPLRDLLYGLMVPSGNDAAVAIAHHISGDVEGFASVMNSRAKQLGATHSHFVNPHGLPDEDHYVTVYDMYLIFQEAMKNPEFRKIARTAEYTCAVEHPSDISKNRDVTWTSGNAFYSGKFSFAENMEILCGKTGHTNAAGFCLVLGEKDAAGKQYVSIIMNSPIYEQMYVSMRTLAAKSQK